MKMKFKEYITGSRVKVFYEYTGNQSKQLWVARAHGTGSVTPNTKSYMTSKRTDANFESNAEKIGEWAKQTTAIKSVDNSKLFELYTYGIGKSPFNGDTPLEKEFMVVTKEKSIVINFFKKKGEAIAWLGQRRTTQMEFGF